MIYCKRCLYPANHPLGLTLDADGVCSGCRVHEEKDTLEWEPRFEKLKALVEPYRDRTGFNYDCLVPVSGDQDSFWIVHVVTHMLGLNPLLVSYNSEYNHPVGIRNLARLRTVFDCDMIQQSLDPGLLRRVTRATLKLRGSMYWHVLAGRYTFPVRTAVRFRVPLIIWGHNRWLDQVGMFSHTDEVEMTEKVRHEHGMMGLDARDLADHGVSERDLSQFLYPDLTEIERLGVRGVYLGNYLRWDSTRQQEEMIRLYGYETRQQERTFNTYENAGCLHSAGIHDWIKFLKWGYGKATDHACREIRFGRMTREQGIDQVARYQWHRPADMNAFLDWIGMSEAELTAAIDSFRDPAVWKRTADGWTLRDSVVEHRHDLGVDAVRLPKGPEVGFKVSAPLPGDGGNRAVILGRGWHAPDEYRL